MGRLKFSVFEIAFPFDAHMMIHSPNAPAKANALHKALHQHCINKVNPRNEFIRRNLAEISKVVEAHHGVIEYVVDPEALEYRQSIAMSDKDAMYIESLYEDRDGKDDNT